MRSSGGFAANLELLPDEVAPHVLTLAAAAAGTAGILRTDLSRALATTLVAALLAGTALALLRRRQPGRRPVRALWTRAGWRLFLAGGAPPQDAELVAAWGRRHGVVIALLWRLPESGRRHWAWFTPRTLPADAWRRLRVRLHLA